MNGIDSEKILKNLLKIELFKIKSVNKSKVQSNKKKERGQV